MPALKALNKHIYECVEAQQKQLKKINECYIYAIECSYLTMWL